MTVQPDVDILIRARAKDLGITLEQAYEIYKMPFCFAKHIMEQGNLDDYNSCESVYIKGLGTIAPKKSQIKEMKRLRDLGVIKPRRNGTVDNGE